MRLLLALVLLLTVSGCLVQKEAIPDTPTATVVLRYPLMDFGQSPDPENSTVKNWTAFVILVSQVGGLDIEGDESEGGASLWGQHCSLVRWNRDTHHVDTEQWATSGPAVPHPGLVIIDPARGQWEGSMGSSGSGPLATPVDPRSGQVTLRSIVSSSGTQGQEYRELVHLRFEQDTEPTTETPGDPGTSTQLQFHTSWMRDDVRHHATDDISIENWGAVPATARAANVYCM